MEMRKARGTSLAYGLGESGSKLHVYREPIPVLLRAGLERRHLLEHRHDLEAPAFGWRRDAPGVR